MKLAELERYFASAATSGTGPLAGLDQVFIGSGSLDANARLAIYNRGYYYRLLDALASVFGQTKRVLGDAHFEQLGLAYLAQHPSQHPAVERVGRAFPDFLDRESSHASPTPDLARLEWARLCALVAANPQTLALPDAVHPSEFPRARLRFVPALHYLELDPRAVRAFAATELPSPPGAPEFAPERSGVAVWRAQHAVQHQAVDRLEFRALRAASERATMAQVCAVFDSGREVEDAQRAYRVISAWFARKWVENVDLSGA